MPSSHTGSDKSRTVRLSALLASRWLIGSTLTIAVLSYASHLIQRARGGDSIALFDVGDEVSIGTWFESAQFMIAGLLLASLLRTGVTDSHLTKRVGLLAVVMFGLSIDESVSIHERVGSALRDTLSTTGYLYYVWVIPAVLAALLLAAWEIPWLRSLPDRVRNRVVASGAIFLAAAGGLELLAGPDDEVSGTATLRSVTLTAFEELGEMLAISLFIVAIIELQSGRSLQLRFDR